MNTASPYESDDEQFFAAVGRLTLAWGLIDAALDVLILAIHIDFGGKRHVGSEIPWNLSGKVRYLRKVIFRLEPFKSSAAVLMPLLAEISNASEYRHDLVHGVLMSAPEPEQHTRIVRLLRRGRREAVVSTEDILANARSARILGGRLVNLALALGEFEKNGEAACSNLSS